MFNIFACNEEEKEDRSHQDNARQYCPYCDEMTNFIWDRCEVCNNN